MKTLTPPRDLTRRDLIKAGAIGAASLLLAPCFSAINPTEAFGVVNTLKSSEGILDMDQRFKMSVYEIENYQFTGVNGSSRMYDGNRYFFVPVKNKNGGFTYADFFDIYFKKACIDNREISIKVHVDKLEVTSTKESNAGNLGSLFEFCAVDKASFWFMNNGSIPGVYTPVRYRWYIDYTVTITWKSSGQIVEGPFYQAVTDLDAGSAASYYSEAWTAKTGFTGDYFIYDKNYLRISGSTFSAPKTGSPTSVSGNESLTKAGVIAATNNGKFSGRFQEGRCGTELAIFSPLAQLPSPNKSFKIS